MNADLTHWKASHDGALLDAAAAEIASARQELVVAQSSAPHLITPAKDYLPLEASPLPAAGTPGSAGQAAAPAVPDPAAVAATLAKIDAINANLQQARAGTQYLFAIRIQLSLLWCHRVVPQRDGTSCRPAHASAHARVLAPRLSCIACMCGLAAGLEPGASLCRSQLACQNSGEC